MNDGDDERAVAIVLETLRATRAVAKDRRLIGR